MLEHVQLAKAKASKHPSQLGKGTKEKLQALLKENKCQQSLTERKVKALERKVKGIRKKTGGELSGIALCQLF